MLTDTNPYVDDSPLSAADVDEAITGFGPVIPRRDNEFTCEACWLIKPLHQAAKPGLCTDCL